MKRKSAELGNDREQRCKDKCPLVEPQWASLETSHAGARCSASSVDTGNNCRNSSMVLALKEDASMTGDAEEDDDYEETGDITLRQWLSIPGRVVDRVACLHIFKQVAEFVDLAQTQGVILRTIRPSCFMISPLHRIRFIECGSSSSELSAGQEGVLVEPEQASGQLVSINVAPIDPAGPGASSGSEIQRADGQQSDDYWTSSMDPSDKSSQEIDVNFPLRQVLSKEQTWYTSPEELTGGSSSYASDVYSLGVLFFELFYTFNSNLEWARAMSDLRHRILPPRLLSECPKEAALCLWLLHPEAQCRPKAREVLQCDLLSDAGEALAEREAAVDIEEKVADSALLLDFLLRVQTEKEEAAQKLARHVNGLTMDIKEIEKRRALLKKKGSFAIRKIDEGYIKAGRNRDYSLEASEDTGLWEPGNRFNGDHSLEPAAAGKRHGEVLSRSARLMSNFNQLEQAYFSMRWKMDPPAPNSLEAGSSGSKEPGNSSDRLGVFFDSLCKYARYSRFEVKAVLRHGDLLNTANMVCSLSFDRDEEFFATAGVCKKIKVFECETVLNEHVDIHYPVGEMVSRSKLSSICWNSYIKSHLASSDYDGVIQLWDASTNQPLLEYKEHKKRAWSVDFSHADPTKLASGSDDGSVKLWSINQEASIGTIKTNANVCCVQFPSDSANLLAFGSADYKIYCYDLRNTKGPLCVLASHNKAVSYVKFVDSMTLVSASTDSTLKLWDLSKVLRNGSTSNACCLTYSGHTNEKNFVGLSVADGYIACGSETNTVYTYHKSLPMPVATHKFGSLDPLSGQETEDDGGQFVSSVCWRGKSQTLVAANSMGNIKVLELV